MSRVARRLIAIAAAGAALLAAAPAAAEACPGATAPAGAQSTSQLEQTTLCLINEQRAAAGSASVRPNGQLRAAGMRHSSDMVRGGYFAHTSPGGVDFIDRIRATGYTRGARTWLVGENLVWGSGSLSSPAALVRSWMQSPPHRANLLKPRFREIGIAAVRGTPSHGGDATGVTVSSEYGFRPRGGKGKKAKSCKAAKRLRARGKKLTRKLKRKLKKRCKKLKSRKLRKNRKRR